MYTFGATMEAILRLQPGAQEVVVVAGSGSFDAYLTDLARRQLAPYRDRVRFTYLNDLALAEQVARVAALPPGTAVLFLSVTRDVAGGQFVPAEAIAQVAAAAGAPVYGPVDSYLGRGLVGGALVSYEVQGAEIAGLAGQVLAGAPAAALPPVRAGTNPYVFDWRQLRRWGLREDRLPAGSEVRYKELSVWERYRAPIAGAAGLVALETVLIASLLTERHRRQRAQAAERAAQGQREALSRELTHLSRVATVGELGASLAHELTQPLAAIRANAEAGRRFLAAPGPGGPDLAEVDAILADIGADDARAAAVIARLRALLRKEPAERRPLDLSGAVAETAGLVAPDAARRGVALDLDLAPDLPPVLGDRVQLQQVVLNLLLNGLDAAAGHAGPRGSLTVRTRRGAATAEAEPGAGGEAGAPAGEVVEVVVEDSGPGLDPAAAGRLFEPFYTTKPSGLGMGLTISRTIAEAHGGRLRAADRPTGGAAFTLTLPAAPPAAPAPGPRRPGAAGEAAHVAP